MIKQIVLLPVRLYDKCSNVLFEISITPETITLMPINMNTHNNENNLFEIILCNSTFGINTIPIFFPLTFLIIKNELVCDNFYIFQILSSHNDLDFLNQLLIQINKHNKTHFKLYNNMNTSYLINILKLHTNDSSLIDSDNINTLINKTFYRITRYLNFCFAIMIENSISNVASTSKLLQIINLIKQYKINFYGNTLTIEEHIEHIMNPALIKRKRYYFYEKDNKVLKIYIEKQNTFKDSITAYPSKYRNHATTKNLLTVLIINDYYKLFDIAAKVLYKKNPMIYNLMINIIHNNMDGYIGMDIINAKSNLLIKCISNNVSFNKFKNIIDKENFNEILLNELFDNHSYPINYDKRTINEHFAKILYYCFKFNENIMNVNLNTKLKSVIIFLIKIYKSLLKEDHSILYISRLYTDTLVYQIFKIILSEDTYGIFNNIPQVEIIKQKFINNLILIHILNNLSWTTISKQLVSFKFVIGLKDVCKDLILSDGKLNKHHTYNMDNRLKKIIIDPLLMFNYLKKENDFYKWIMSFKEHIMKIFNNMITLDNSEFKKLSQILYTYSKIKNQSLQDTYYKKLLHILKENNKIVLFNDRINIKFKDIFKNININLGFMARDIVNEESISVSISDDHTINSSNDSITIEKLKRKYYKYKGKYLEIKCSMTETNNYNNITTEL
jgi:hypothetical protein